METSKTSPALSIFSKILPLGVLGLIFMGALVTSNDAGLAVPDWPNTYGENMFLYPPSKWTGGIFYEHVHRLIASGIGLLTFVLTVWVLKTEKRKWMRWTALVALAAVILQGILGGMTVLYQLPVSISSFHAILAQSFLCLTIFIAYMLGKEFNKRRESGAGDRKIFRKSVFVTVLVFIQLAIGAVMRHSGSGLAVLDFPTMGGEWLPTFSASMLETLNSMRAEANLYPITNFHAAIHVAHRAFAVLIALAVIGLFVIVGKSTYRDSKVNKLTGFVMALMIVQFLLGIIAVLSVRSPVPTSIHVACGALLLALLFYLSLISFPMTQRT